jgi:nitronate monooxygenase
MWSRNQSGPALRSALKERLSVPLFVAPMFLISGPDLIIASAQAGALSAFPSINARTPEELDEWLARIAQACPDHPWGINLIVHKSNARFKSDLEATVRARAPVVVAPVGAPDEVTGPVHDYGGIVFSDVASLRHARKAVAACADGLVLLTAGAGGNTGWINPFAFVAQVREFFDGPIAIAGAIGTGRALHALEILDADLGYAGTPFIATPESLAQQGHKDMVVRTNADGVALSELVTGIPANFARESLLSEGIIDASGTPLHHGALDIASWKTVWSMGHGCGTVSGIRPTADLIAEITRDWRAARQISRDLPAQ